MHYLHQLWPEDYVRGPVIDVLHVKHEAAHLPGNAFMAVRQSGETGETLRSAGLSDIELGCEDDEQRKRSLLAKAKRIRPGTQMERFLYLSARDFAECYQASAHQVHTTEASVDGQSPLAFIRDEYVASGRYDADLEAEDGVSTEKYRRLVYEPAFSRKMLFPPLRAWDDTFQGLLRLLGNSLKAYLPRRMPGDPPAFWMLVFWSLCYRSCGREEYFAQRQGGRLPLPRADEIDAVARDQEANKGFTNRYRVQGAVKTNTLLHRFLSGWKKYFEAYGGWESLSPTGLTPRKLHHELSTKLIHAKDFMAWQVKSPPPPHNSLGADGSAQVVADLGMLLPDWWTACQEADPFFMISAGAARGYARLFGRAWSPRQEQEGIANLKNMWARFHHPTLRGMNLIDIEQALCEYSKFCAAVEVNAFYVRIPFELPNAASPKGAEGGKAAKSRPRGKRRCRTKSSSAPQGKGKRKANGFRAERAAPTSVDKGKEKEDDKENETEDEEGSELEEEEEVEQEEEEEEESELEEEEEEEEESELEEEEEEEEESELKRWSEPEEEMEAEEWGEENGMAIEREGEGMEIDEEEEEGY